MWGALVWLGKAVYAAVKFVVVITAKWAAWAALHPLAAIGVAVVAEFGRRWLLDQPWMGSETVAGLVGYAGMVFASGAFYGFVFKPIVVEVGAGLATLLAILENALGNLPPPFSFFSLGWSWGRGR